MFVGLWLGQCPLSWKRAAVKKEALGSSLYLLDDTDRKLHWIQYNEVIQKPIFLPCENTCHAGVSDHVLTAAVQVSPVQYSMHNGAKSTGPTLV